MIKELRYVLIIFFILIFFFLTIKYYLSDEHKKKYYRTVNEINNNLSIDDQNIPILKDDTQDIITYVDDKNEKTKKLSDELKVGEVPAFRFFRSGEQVWQYAGANEKILRMTIIDNLEDGEKR